MGYLGQTMGAPTKSCVLLSLTRQVGVLVLDKVKFDQQKIVIIFSL